MSLKFLGTQNKLWKSSDRPEAGSDERIALVDEDSSYLE